MALSIVKYLNSIKFQSSSVVSNWNKDKLIRCNHVHVAKTRKYYYNKFAAINTLVDADQGPLQHPR